MLVSASNPRSLLDFNTLTSYVDEAFSPLLRSTVMGGLGDVVRGLAAREGVEAVLVLSADGLPIEHASKVPFEPESLAALTATLGQYATRLGLGAGRGALRTAVLEYERGLLIVAQITGGDGLAILASPSADVGELLYDLRQHRPALAALL
jgi:predicted regulator of Ras-like GTPase activity (Roadblock/LC7/MglB family)